MAELVYILCAITSVLCAVLLLRAYLVRRRSLLLWSAACFGALGLNNVLLFVDLVLEPTRLDLAGARSATALAGLAALAYGLIAGDQ